MHELPQDNIGNTDKRILWLVAGIILLKLILLPFSQTVDCDAVERTFFSEDWMNNHIWITNGVWGPFHFYLAGSALAVWNNYVYAPVILNIILSSIMLLPFYYFVRREFNSNGALAASFFLSICPIIFRNSMMNMSEAPYLLLLTIALNFLSRGFKSSKASDFLLSGLSITIASGFRFEAWFLIIVLTFILFTKKQRLNTFLFFLTAVTYPLIDILTHFIMDHYSLSGFFSNYPWNMQGVSTQPNWDEYLRRIWFMPLCWVVALGPPVAFIVLREIIFAQKKGSTTHWLTILFWAFLLLTELTAFKGLIILHARFASTIALLSIPFIAPYFNILTTKKIRTAFIFGLLTIGLTFAYNMNNITPLPRLSDQDGAKVAGIIKKDINNQSGLIIDFWGWENTYYLGLQSNLPTHNIYILNGANSNILQPDDVNVVINTHSQGIILLVKKSLLWQNAVITDKHLQFKFSPLLLNSEEIFSNADVIVLKYTVSG